MLSATEPRGPGPGARALQGSGHAPFLAGAVMVISVDE